MNNNEKSFNSVKFRNYIFQNIINLSPIITVTIVLITVFIFENINGITFYQNSPIVINWTAPTGLVELASESNRRLQWSISAVLLCLTCTLCLLGSLRIFHTYYSRFKTKIKVFLIAPVILTGIIYILIALLRSTTSFELFSSGITSTALNYNFLQRADSDSIEPTVNIISFFSIYSFSLLLFAFCAIISASRKFADIGQYKRGHENLGTLLYLGSFLLVASTLNISALFSWGIEFAQGSNSNIFLLSLKNSATNLAGFVFSMVLVAVYLPTEYILKLRTDKYIFNKISNTIYDDLEREKKLHMLKKDGGLDNSIKPKIGRMLAIIAPFILNGISEEIIKGVSF